MVGGLGPDDDYTFTASVPTTKLAKNSQAYPVDEPLQPAGQRLDELPRALPAQRSRPAHPGAAAGSLPAEERPLQRRHRRAQRPAGARHQPARRRSSSAPSRIVGNDEQYAAFMALAANRLRVPARVVVGTFTPRTARSRAATSSRGWSCGCATAAGGSCRPRRSCRTASRRRDDEPPQSLEDFVQDQLPTGRRRQTRTRRSRCRCPTTGREPGQQDRPERLERLPARGLPLGRCSLLALVPLAGPRAQAGRRLAPSAPQAASAAGGRCVARARRPRCWTCACRVRGSDPRGTGASAGRPRRCSPSAPTISSSPSRPPDAEAATDYWRDVDQGAAGPREAQHSLRRQFRALYNPASLVARLRRGSSRVRRRQPVLRALRRPRGAA